MLIFGRLGVGLPVVRLGVGNKSVKKKEEHGLKGGYAGSLGGLEACHSFLTFLSSFLNSRSGNL